MSQFKGLKPKAQPRSLRSIAESQNGAGSFVHGEGPGEQRLEQDPVYMDVADAARPSESVRQVTAADPPTFGNMRRG